MYLSFCPLFCTCPCRGVIVVWQNYRCCLHGASSSVAYLVNVHYSECLTPLYLPIRIYLRVLRSIYQLYSVTQNDDIFYFDSNTGVSTWMHPCDVYYENLLRIERKKKAASATTAHSDGGHILGHYGTAPPLYMSSGGSLAGQKQVPDVSDTCIHTFTHTMFSDRN